MANLLSLHLGLPLTDFNGLLERRLLSNGRRSLGKIIDLASDTPLNVLIVDDSLHTGAELDRTRAKLAQHTLPHRIQFGAVYVQPGWEKAVDFSRVALAHPRAFEWNIFHHPALDQSCVDIDGILCRDPLEEENDDGENYVKFLEMVRPKFRTSQKIAEHEAIGIATLSGRPVYCADTRQMVYPGGKRREPTLKDKLTWKFHRLQRKAHSALRGAFGRSSKAAASAS